MEDYEACTCMNIHKSTLTAIIKEKNLKTLEKIQQETRAGTICFACCDDIKKIIKENKSSRIFNRLRS
ncbi:MAG: (2Fe-2S)-binding protein [Bacteroidota bacterium]